MSARTDHVAEPSTVDATVVILTFNGEQYLRRILDALTIQEFDGSYEVLVIDSGSTDSTLAIIADFPDVRLQQIPNSQFQHGRTRNLAAKLAHGTYIAYLTHDAIPSDKWWLHSIIEPMRQNARVAGVLGRQSPRPQCFPLLKREIRQVFAGQGPDFGTSFFYRDPERDGGSLDGAATFYSDVNSATRRDLLLTQIPYREVEYAEDQLFGRDILDAGYIKAYAGQACVEHSNDLTRAELASRMHDEIVGQRRIGLEIPAPSVIGMWKSIVGWVLRGWIDTLRDPDYSLPRKIYWLAANPAYVVTKFTSLRRSALHDLGDISGKYSLEARRRLGQQD